ncbi:hypothetical protein [Daejeonella lutea]|uniref:PEP-CTERM protein-sorting domain-containing protein n=1 Tax=Daejeonella lutea TaxID=572036 RepID=A0A1T5A0V3_9SPHI|nr:hypothetical protein [Daejeonella lutea]SKB28399.1 PEP-CTERM protein-sorting domain-containing protein [Daejeonella lutea]
MRTIILILAIVLRSVASYSQDWETVQIDSTVSVKLPKGFTKTEKDEKYSLVAVSPWGTILIFKTPDNPTVTPDIEKEKHLKRYYDDYIKNVRTVSSSSIIKDEKDETIGDLKVKDFTLQIDTGSGVLYRNFRLLHASSATYIFEFLYQDLHNQFAIPEKEKFFNSIEVNENLDKTDQYTSEEINKNNAENKKYLYWAIPGGLLLIGIIFYIVRRRKT